MKNPLVTVITPTYNRASFLGETLKSVINQDYPNIEYLVLDDGSTDDTNAILKKFGKKIIWETHKNIGEVRTVNKGFSLAHGEIITIVNSDDPLIPGAIKKMVKFLIDNPDVIVTYPDWIKIDEKGKRIGKTIAPEYSFEYMVSAHDNVTGPGTFFRKKLLDKLGGRDTRFRYVSDYDFWLRAGLLGKFARVPEVLATSRSHSDQTTLKNKGFAMAMEHLNVINKLFSLSNLPPGLRKIKPEAYAKACEAARICRGGNLITKIVISLVCLYYSPISYLRAFFAFRLVKIRELLVK